MTLALGQIGRYELLARLGVGGMGEVFLARTSGTGGFEKEVVIKRMLPHLANDPDFIDRFIDEGKLVVQLRHASIAQVLDMGEEQGITFIAMEYVDGRDLAELVRLASTGGVKLPPALVVTVLVKVLEALDYAHRAKDSAGRPMGIIHRDVSPSNVMLSRSGEVKLLDFGIAKATERLSTSTSGAIRGKYNYMSPQQAAGRDLDARSDLFSVGVMAWELLAGVRPFDAESDLRTLDNIRFQDPGSLQAVNPEVPDDLTAVVGRLIAKDPDGRYTSADEALRAFQSYLFRTQAQLTSRDLAAWVAEVHETLPVGLRARQGGGLSLDDVLMLGLGSRPSGPAPGTGPISPATVAVGAPARVTTGQAVQVVPVSEPRSITVEVPSRKRTTLVAALIVFNVALLGAVAYVLFGQGGDAPTPPNVEGNGLIALVGPLGLDRPPAVLASEPDVAPVPVVAETPVTAGLAAGARLVDAAELAFRDREIAATRVPPRLRPPSVTPANANTGQLEIRVRPATVVMWIGKRQAEPGAGHIFKETLSIGQHTLRFKLGERTASKTVVITKEQPVRTHFLFPPEAETPGG
ncbi:MAG: hypothetical protein ACI9MR_000336 [Myxococcota bacterium]